MAALSSYVDFSEDLSTRYVGTAAIKSLVGNRLNSLYGEIPYDDFSLSSFIFSQGQQSDFFKLYLKSHLADLDADVTVTQDGRVTAAGVTIDLLSLIGSSQ